MDDWTGSTAERRPQLPCECPEGFRGGQRYIDREAIMRPALASRDAVLMPFGQHKGQPVGELPTSYLYWLWQNVKLTGPLLAAVRTRIGPKIAERLTGANVKAKKRRRGRSRFGRQRRQSRGPR